MSGTNVLANLTTTYLLQMQQARVYLMANDKTNTLVVLNALVTALTADVATVTATTNIDTLNQ